MPPLTTSVFDLAAHPAKDEPARITDDERHFAAMSTSLDELIADLTSRLDVLRRTSARKGKQAIERDLEIHELNRRLRTLRRFRLDLCLGRIVSGNPEDGSVEVHYIGRIGLTDRTGRQLLIDWRAPAAAPFFSATPAHPMGLRSRRRYRWGRGQIVDYWDEVFTTDAADDGSLVLDDDSAFIAGLGASRSPRMRDVLSTIASDQDTIVRADSHGALAVDGGPGTGKTVVALHRAAYLLYADPRLAGNRGGVLVVGPHEPYLGYIADVLPSLGEESVQTVTLRDLLPEGARARPETDPTVARLKASSSMVDAIEPAVRFYETPPTTSMTVETDWADVVLTRPDWAEAFAAPEAGTPHNEARDQVWEALVDIIIAKHDRDVPTTQLRNSLADNEELTSTLGRAWPILEYTDLVGDLWSVPAYLRLCAPELVRDDVAALQRTDVDAWTTSDLPLLDAARRRLGDPAASRRRRHAEAQRRAGHDRMERVVDELLDSSTYDDGEGLMSMLRSTDLRDVLDDADTVPTNDADVLAGPFAHIIVDEAQELTDAEWQMLLARCPSRSFTVVGDRAQARSGFTDTWTERLERVGLRDVTMASLTVNYRTPEEIMTHAEPVIRAALPDANVPTSIRSSGLPVRHAAVGELDEILRVWLAENDEGTACVIGDPAFVGTARVRSLSPQQAKGLEYDLVVLVNPDEFGSGVTGAVDRYVAMTRATRELVVLDQ
ncbi:RNA polymerase recycling motor ATPase HelR [Gordonia sp. PKS22-38]|uniref:RNA polymerase recycling motor ATPase HelR n=1 Tax=Gordonia prachuapensis TaxID=3115651 RepID=A0ABU7MTZ1_9ACTN|nr:RNA polymerase recycling motor ATPase HelR [Gordonia sp. PKS22-38]